MKSTLRYPLLPVLLLAACTDLATEPPSATETLQATPEMAGATNSTDRTALVALYEATGGEDWKRTDNWLSDKPLEQWYGITTDQSGRVIGINLSDNDLSGPLPKELGDLAGLVSLRAQDNELTGSIPAELGNLGSLRTLWLSDNKLTGTLPEQLHGAVNLIVLLIANNRLDGALSQAALHWGLFFLDVSGNETLCVPGTRRFEEWTRNMVAFDGSWCHEKDIEVLAGLYEATGGDNWTVTEGWFTGLDLSAWFGVTTDSVGRVRRLYLPYNGLSGSLPEEVAELASMAHLDIRGNDLEGSLSKALMDLPLKEFRYRDTELCAPDDPAFLRWLNSIDTHEGTGIVCRDLNDREILEIVYEALGGENWINNDNWLTDAPLRDWYGVRTNGDGNVVSLRLESNLVVGKLPPEIGGLSDLYDLNLGNNIHFSGPLPPELFDLRELFSLNIRNTRLGGGGLPPEIGRLSKLKYLDLRNARLTGTIPPEIGDLSELTILNLDYNYLFGAIPPELGELSKLERLFLSNCRLGGPIPAELGNLSSLTNLGLGYNDLTGELPPTLGELRSLRTLDLRENQLTGPIPQEWSDLESLQTVYLHNNRLDGPLPETLGNLKSARVLFLNGNDFKGPLPDFGEIEQLQHLWVGDNPDLSGPVPRGMANLTALEYFKAGGTDLCAPHDADFQTWLSGVPFHRLATCEAPPLYLVQTVQSRDFPVPLVPRREALLRVFVASEQAEGEKLPHMRARFYVNDSQVHVAEVPHGTGTVPKEVDEGNLESSLNARIPPHVIRPGLEVVVELTGAALQNLGIPSRIPATGRMALDVADLQDLRLTLVPFLYEQDPDYSIIEIIEGMAEDPDGHAMLTWTRTLLPVADWDIEQHDPVISSTNNGFLIRNETEAMRRMEGRPGYWLSMISPVAACCLFGVAYGIPSWTSFSLPLPRTVAHELGHNMGLWHAPCGGAGGPDPLFPHKWGTIGSWGYDHEHDRLVNPHTPDIMSYCGGQWVSDYHMANAVRHRMYTEAAWDFGTKTESLLVWGWVDRDGTLSLDPSFIVDALPSAPPSGNDYTVRATTTAGAEAFSFRFDMPTTHEVDDQQASFVFAIPVTWSGDLASITLSGNNQTTWIDEDTNNPMTILRDPVTGQVRAFLRHEAEQALEMAGDPGLDVLFSRGLPR